MAMLRGVTKRVQPLQSLNPYQDNWVTKVRVTNKGPLRSYRNARGEGSVFNVELTDEEGTQIQATMFKEAADRFHEKFQLGKLYLISKGSLRMANKQYSTVNNDYEMTLDSRAVVEEVEEDEGADITIPLIKYNFVGIDDLGPFVNARKLVDVVGVVQDVSPVMTIRRKVTNEEIPKRDITIADKSQKTVVVSLWNEFATKTGEELLDLISNKESPTVAVKALRVSDYQGVSLSTTVSSMVAINPDIPEAKDLEKWYKSDGKDATLTSAGAGLGGASRGPRSLYSERDCLSNITLPAVGEDKAVYFNVKAYVSYIKPDQAMWYLACAKCNRKVTEEHSSQYWCEACQTHSETCNRRYIMQAKLSDRSGEAWVSAFNEQAEQILQKPADDLAKMREEDPKLFTSQLKEVSWMPYIFRVSVAQQEYMNEKRQRLTVRSLSPIDWSGESKYMLDQIASLKA